MIQQKLINRNFVKLLFVVFILCCLYTSAIAQKISASINRDKILIGEPVELTLKADDIDLTKFNIKQWFIVADTFNHIEIIQRGILDTIRVGNNTGYVQKIQLTSFDSGYWQVPAFAIDLENKADGKTATVATSPLNIAVLPVDVANLKDYHDIKDIEEVPVENNWQIIAAIAATAVLSFFGLLWILSKRKKQVAVVKVSGNQNPYDWALLQIEQLLQKQFLEQQQYKQFYTELVTICRNFSDMELGLKTTAKTTDEYILLIKGRIGTEPVQLQYFQLLRLSNAVKFAKYIPLNAQNEEAVTIAQTFIHTLHQFQNR